MSKTKVCATCRKRKLRSKFHSVSKHKDGLDYNCKTCVSDYRKRTRHKYLARMKRYSAKYRLLGKRVAVKRRSDLKRSYGLTPEDVEQMKRSQGGRCAICQKRPRKSQPGSLLCVDHCHSTQKVRGLLCGLCNKMIGLASDSVDRLKSAIKYLNSCSE